MTQEYQRKSAAIYAIVIMIMGAGLWCQYCSVKNSTTYPRESFRGETQSDRIHWATDYEIADQLVQIIGEYRSQGVEPQRIDFHLPEGWRPPPRWTAPADFQPPEWWPDEKP